VLHKAVFCHVKEMKIAQRLDVVSFSMFDIGREIQIAA
jgi:hypothetical protein